MLLSTIREQNEAFRVPCTLSLWSGGDGLNLNKTL